MMGIPAGVRVEGKVDGILQNEKAPVKGLLCYLVSVKNKPRFGGVFHYTRYHLFAA